LRCRCMATEHQEESRSLPGMSIGKTAPSPRNVVLLHNLTEIHALWGVGEDRIYRAVAHGALRAYGRPGRAKYYSESELIALLGPKRFGPSNGPAKLSASDNGR